MQKEGDGSLCYESSIMYRHCLLNSIKFFAVNSELILRGERFPDGDLVVGFFEAITAILTDQKHKILE